MLLIRILAAAFYCAVVAAQVAAPAAPFNGRLYTAALNGNPQALKAADANRVAPSLRPRFERFLTCQSTFRSRLPQPEGFFAKAAWPKQQSVERAIACLIEAPGIAELAADYAGKARILYEWEGLSSSPIEESEYAERYIDDHPSSPLVPYLCLFVAQRTRYAFEFMHDERDLTALEVLASRYRSFIGWAKRADPMIALVADDLDALPFVYRNVGKHPRDF